MSAMGLNGNELERLVDRHIELCELLVGTGAPLRREVPMLITLSDGKAVAECLADLVDRVLVVYEGSGFAQDTTIFSLKAALTAAIFDLS